MSDKDVNVTYLDETGKWIICRDNGDLVKIYNAEADAMFDYAALRNGEMSISQVELGRDHNDEDVQLIDIYICTHYRRKPPAVETENGCIDTAWDFLMGVLPNWLSVDKNWRPWIRLKARNLGRHILLRYHYKDKTRATRTEVISPPSE